MKKKVLYAINGTGQGHISRAKSLIPLLSNHLDIDILISGKLQDLNFDYPVKYVFRGLTFYYEKGGVNWIKTILKLNIIQFFRDCLSLNLKNYDLVITDFEPISAWACLLKKKKCLNISHQAAFYSIKSPRPNGWIFFLFFEFLLKTFCYTRNYIGVHYKSYDHFIIAPILKPTIINSKPILKNHITVYLSSFDYEFLLTFFNQFPSYTFEIFHKECLQEKVIDNLRLFPLSEQFQFSLISCSGYITNAGFESTAEALYLEKPLLAVPTRLQYEQYLNAAALKQLGVNVQKKLTFDSVNSWLETKAPVPKVHAINQETLVKKILTAIS